MNTYGIVFNMAITYLMDVGYNSIDEVDTAEIRRKAEENEAKIREECKFPIMTADFQVELAKEIARCASPVDLLVFVKDCMPLDTGRASVEDMARVLYNVVSYTYEDTIGSYSWKEWLKVLAYECDLGPEELEEMMNY